MKRDFLKELELSDEQIDAVMKEHGKSINEVKDKADKVDTLESQINDYKQQIADRDKQLDDLKDKAKGNEDLEKQIQDLQKQNEDAQKEWEQKLTQQQKQAKVELALRESGAEYPDLVKDRIDFDKISLDGDNLIGFEEQVNNIKEKYAKLFASEEDNLPDGIKRRLKGKEPHPSDPNKQPQGITKEQFEKMSYVEKMNLYNNDLETYQKLTKGE